MLLWHRGPQLGRGGVGPAQRLVDVDVECRLQATNEDVRPLADRGVREVEALEQAEVHLIDVVPHLGHLRTEASEHLGGVTPRDEQGACVRVLAKRFDRLLHLRRDHVRYRRMPVEDRQQRRGGRPVHSAACSRKSPTGTSACVLCRWCWYTISVTWVMQAPMCACSCGSSSAARSTSSSRCRAIDAGFSSSSQRRIPSRQIRDSNASAATPVRRPTSAPIHSGSLGPSGPGGRTVAAGGR